MTSAKNPKVRIDNTVVFRRRNGVSGSGTMLHCSATYLVLEIYDQNVTIHLNEFFTRIRISHDRSIMYDGDGVVCNVVHFSSMQMVTLFLVDPWIAFGICDLDADNRFEVQRFLEMSSVVRSMGCDRLEPEFLRFTLLLSQMLDGLKGNNNGARVAFSKGKMDVSGSDYREEALHAMVDRLHDEWQKIGPFLADLDEEASMRMGVLFKQFLFPLSRNSRIFKYFHSWRRTPYFNLSALEATQTNERFWSVGLRGLLLDLFFVKFVGFDGYEKRCDHLVQQLGETLESREGEIRVLVIGTDDIPRRVVENLPADRVNRLLIDVWTFHDEKIGESVGSVSSLARKKGVDLKITGQHLPIEHLMKQYFSGEQKEMVPYDEIYSTSAVTTCSDKLIPNLVQFLLRRLTVEGKLRLFSDNTEFADIREYWLLWYTHLYSFDECKKILPDTYQWTCDELPFGNLVTVSPG